MEHIPTGPRKLKWWSHLLWPVVIVLFLFNIFWVNVCKKDPVGK
jgi:hypothetical protein